MKSVIIVVYLLSHLLIFAVIFVPHWLNIRLWQIPEGYIDHPLIRWDVEWYLRIAEYGYRYTPNSTTQFQNYVAFFPLYPLLMRVLGTIIGYLHLAGILISALSGMIALFYLFHLQKLWADDDSAKRVILILSLFPTAFFLQIAYSEALFLCLTVMAAYYSRTKQWWIAAFLIGLASASRPSGVFMLFVLGYEWAEALDWNILRLKENWLRISKLILLSASGILLYMLYLRIAHMNAFAFVDSVTNAWGRSTSNPIEASIRALQNLNINPYRPAYLELVEVIVLWFAFMVSILIGRRFHWGYGFYCIASLYLASSARPEGILRYILVLFPLMMFLADKLRGRSFVLYLLGSTAMLILLTFWHTNWLFVG